MFTYKRYRLIAAFLFPRSGASVGVQGLGTSA